MTHGNGASTAVKAIGFAAVALLAFAAARLIGNQIWAGAALLLIVLTAVLAAWLHDRATTVQLRRAEEHARALLETDWRSHQEPAAPAQPTRAGPLATLHRLLNDLGARQRSQLKDVARNTRNLESLIGALDEPVLATDSRDRILLSNRAAEAMLEAQGADGGGLVGRPFREVITHEALLEHHAHARRGELRRGRVQLTTPLGPRAFHVSASPVPAAWGEGVFGVVLLLRDVTELDKAVQVKSDFVANASHELRTPVAAIKGAAETLSLVDPADREQTTRLVGMIESHASRLEEMLRDLMDLSRLESDAVALQAAPLPLADLVESLRALFEEFCRRRSVTLRFELEPALEGMITDRRLLLLALRNLVDNASRFAREGTTVRIVGRLLDGRDTARFEIIDQGPGIPLEHQGRVFERYYQVEQGRSGPKSRRGTGLGLSIVKHAARALGGAVGLESIWGQGTTVWLEIPVLFQADTGVHDTGR